MGLRLWVITTVESMVSEPVVGGEEEVTNDLWPQVKAFTAHSEPSCRTIPGRNPSSWDCVTFSGLIFRERFGNPWCRCVVPEWGLPRDASSLVSLKPQDRALGTLHAFHDFYLPFDPYLPLTVLKRAGSSAEAPYWKMNVPHREILARVCFPRDLASDVFPSGL